MVGRQIDRNNENWLPSRVLGDITGCGVCLFTLVTQVIRDVGGVK